MKNVRSDGKGTKGLQRCYEISYEATKMVRSYEKSTKLRKRYERVTKRILNKLQSYEKGTKVQKWYEVTKDIGYEVTKLRDSNCEEITK